MRDRQPDELRAGGGGKDLDSVVAGVDDVEVALSVDGEATRAVEVAGTGPGAPGRKRRTGRGELHDPILEDVGHVHVSRRVEREAAHAGEPERCVDGARAR